jgi:type I restriction enzyme S subunit
MITDLKPYAEYKESGLPWLGQVPGHWELAPNRSLMRIRKKLVGERHSSFTLLSLTKFGVIVRDISEMRGKFSSDPGTSQEVRKGDLVMCLFDVPETPRTVGLTRHAGMITGAYTVMECRRPESAKFLELFYIAMDDRKLLSPLYSGLRNTIPKERLLGTKTPLPPPAEQAAIVRFLDWANGRLERAIRAKRKVIALLNEQKQAIIHRAVTRGLDPSVPLKDSGVPWLGEIPKHWEIWPLKRIGWFKSGAGFPVADQGRKDLEVPFLKVSDMNLPGNETWIETSNNTVTHDDAVKLGAFIFPEYSIIFPKVGGAMLTNKRRLLRRPSCIDNNVMGCVVRRGHHEFIFLLLQQLDLGRLSKPGPVPAIGEGEVREIKVIFPPIEEQRAIVPAVMRECLPLETTISRLEREITLLRQYRTRLVADVVTGKLDVRAAAASLPDEAPPNDLASSPDPDDDALDTDPDDLTDAEGDA